jgi:hypothetical protein
LLKAAADTHIALQQMNLLMEKEEEALACFPFALNLL